MSQRETEKKTVLLDFACNDYRNGDCLGRFEAVNVRLEFDDEYIEFECDTTSVSFPGSNGLRVGRCLVSHTGKYTWVGNWCWDGARISAEDCAKVLLYLRGKRNARCIGGPCGIFEKFETATEQEIVGELGGASVGANREPA